jgi:3-oxoacyl-[acyl-carrier-protein] synthase III
VRYSRVVIERFGYEMAPCVVTSDELEQRLSSVYEKLHVQPGQLQLMTGIQERRYWDPGYTVTQGATAAALNALKDSPVPSEALDTLIYAGVCREHFEPATACHVGAGLKRAGHAIRSSAHVYDVSNACLGVLNGILDVANRIELGQIRAGMVVSCETARDIVDTTIARLTGNPDMEEFKAALATLTGGSAAVAVILSDGSFGEADRRRLRGAVVETAPEHHMLCRWGVEPHPDGQSNGAEASLREFASTDAAAVLEHGVALGARTWDAFLGEMEWSAEQIDRTVCHQVGSAHRDTMLRTMGLSPENDFATYEYLGNTGTAALPVATALAEERGFITAGQKVGLLGIGSGLNCMMLGVDW